MEREYEQFVQLLYNRIVFRADRAHGDHLAVQELDFLVFEGAQRDELVVLRAAQGANDFSGFGSRHGRSSSVNLACTSPLSARGRRGFLEISPQATLARERMRWRSKITSAISLSFWAS